MNSRRRPSQTLAQTPKTLERRKSVSRSERRRLTREALLRAAAEVVGEIGYQDASISLITQRAGVAQGTFFNYFHSRQDILDQLLPAIGREMLNYLHALSRRDATFLESEELWFRGFFSFLKTHPHFFRILNEASSFAPKAFETHLEILLNGYMRSFRKAQQRGEIPDFSERELEVVAFVLMAARLYLGHYAGQDGAYGDIPDWVSKAYMKFVSDGLPWT
jgi:AcrR family transcriptional regulator